MNEGTVNKLYGQAMLGAGLYLTFGPQAMGALLIFFGAIHWLSGWARDKSQGGERNGLDRL